LNRFVGQSWARFDDHAMLQVEQRRLECWRRRRKAHKHCEKREASLLVLFALQKSASGHAGKLDRHPLPRPPKAKFSLEAS
jgi:hypothetical protein